MENWEDTGSYYRAQLLRNTLPLPRALILSENWKTCPWWKKIKYLVCSGFDKREAQINLAVDYYVAHENEENKG